MPYRIVPADRNKPDAVLARSTRFWPFGVVYQCGHRDGRRFTVRACGTLIVHTPGDDLRCADCSIAWRIWLSERSPPCPLCQKPVLPGERLQPFQDMPAGPVTRSEMAALRIGCLSMGCGMDPDPEQLWTWDGELLQPP